MSEVEPGDDLAGILAAASRTAGIVPARADILVVTQKIVSKAEGAFRRADARDSGHAGAGTGGDHPQGCAPGRAGWRKAWRGELAARIMQAAASKQCHPTELQLSQSSMQVFEISISQTSRYLFGRLRELLKQRIEGFFELSLIDARNG